VVDKAGGLKGARCARFAFGDKPLTPPAFPPLALPCRLCKLGAVKYVSASRINACEEPEQHGAGSGDGVPFCIFSRNYQGLERA